MRTFVRHERSVKDERRWRVIQPKFYDPYWFLNGSVPEHMVMAELARRGIFFEYRAQNNKIGGAVDPTWEADITVPQYKIWIEVQGAYFHTLPGQLRADSLRYAAIKMAGWRPLFYWEWDIHSRLKDLLDETPEFYRVDPSENKGKGDLGLPFKVGSNTDQLKGLRQANANRRSGSGSYAPRRVVRVGRQRK
jgi:very-short-patch-repair endonuclease